MDKVKKWFFEDDDNNSSDDFQEYDEIPVVEKSTKPISDLEGPKNQKTSEAVRKLNANKDSHLVLFEPRAYSETQEIALYLKKNKAAVVNLHRLQKEQSKRVIDFLSGVIFAIDGDIQQIGSKIFLCTPRSIGVTGNITMDEAEVSED